MKLVTEIFLYGRKMMLCHLVKLHLVKEEYALRNNAKDNKV